MDHNEGAKATLLGVPREIRMLIYDYLVSSRVFWVNFLPDDSANLRSGIIGSLNILRTNKQIYEEVQQALKVRTLRINEFAAFDVPKLSRIHHLISRWAATIETVVLSHRVDDPDLEMLRTLRALFASLPNLRVAIFKEERSHWPYTSTQLEEIAKEYARNFLLSLAEYVHISVTSSRTPRHKASTWNVEMKFERGVAGGRRKHEVPRTPGASQNKVLLEVYNNDGRKEEHWLTIDEVDQPS